jgi:hypothetical protein
LTGLVKKIDRRLDKASPHHKENKLGVFVVVCNEDDAAKERVRDLVAAEGFKHVVIGNTMLGGPPRYRVNKDAEQTVAIYDLDGTVVANFALKKGELNEAKTADIIKAMGRVLPTRPGAKP